MDEDLEAMTLAALHGIPAEIGFERGLAPGLDGVEFARELRQNAAETLYAVFDDERRRNQSR